MGHLHRRGALAAVLGLVLVATAAAPAVAVDGADRYRNPISADFADPVIGRADRVWTFPADTSPRIGLVAHGGAQPPVTAGFDHLRFYR